MEPKEIATDVHYLAVRGSNVFFVRSGSSWVLIDAGWGNSGPSIREAAESLFGTDARPVSILRTHTHPDHCGSAAELVRGWGLQVYVHPDDLSLALSDLAAIRAFTNPLDRWIILPMRRIMGQKRREAILAGSSLRGIAEVFEPEAELPGLPDWKYIPTSGHAPGHVAFFRRQDRVMITGDAILTASLGGLLPRR